MGIEIEITGTIKVDDRTRKEVIDAEMEDFNMFARQHLGEPLARAERAIVATYIAWKLGLGREESKRENDG